MKKYLAVFKIGWQDELIYRLNFLLWRLRNILRLLMTYFLWQGIFLNNQLVFGYSQTQISAYVFLVLVIQATVLSAPSADNIGSEISGGDLSNYLLKPLHYRLYWFIRDLSSKTLNILFSFIEISILYIVIHPQIAFSLDFLQLVATIVACCSAVVIAYLLRTLFIYVSFWTPEFTWGLTFLLLVLIEVFAGGIFPLDVLPKSLQLLLQLTPFPYLIYYPISIFLGKISGIVLWQILAQGIIYSILLVVVNNFFWRRGLKVYSSSGR